MRGGRWRPYMHIGQALQNLIHNSGIIATKRSPGGRKNTCLQGRAPKFNFFFFEKDSAAWDNQASKVFSYHQNPKILYWNGIALVSRTCEMMKNWDDSHTELPEKNSYAMSIGVSNSRATHRLSGTRNPRLAGRNWRQWEYSTVSCFCSWQNTIANRMLLEVENC